ncbi:MAG: 50S ribosomal protein L19e [Candidatus Altiarchaeales archaeon HGW-Altiarchaeales-3]|nr:MAG: 50S ribosomal protein L19e [Candidatus Altiarchaeales archaeon HGW-Altiarchaeales-3]
MNLRNQRELASDVLKVGIYRVTMNPEKLDMVSEALTREDINKLVGNGAIIIKPKKGISRGRWRKIALQKQKGRRKGQGHRKGTKNSKVSKKEKWMNKIRAIRDELRKMKAARELEKGTYRKLYRQAKGGFFNSRRHLREHIQKNK